MLDARGRIYFTDARYSGHEPVEQPVQGVYLAYIPTPDPPTNVKFGRGADQQTSFITARKSLYRIRVERSGYHLGF